MPRRWTSILAVLALSLGCDGDPAGRDAGAVDAAPGADAGDRDATTASDAGASPDASDEPDAGRSDAGAPPAVIDPLVARLSDPTATEADLDALLHEVAWSRGWPVREGGRWLFATRWDGAPAPVALVSDVNGWDPSRDVARAAATGVHFWVVVDEGSFSAAPAGAGYKWHGAPDVFRAPPEATAYAFDDFGEIGYVAPPTDRRWRERFEDLASAHLGPTRALRALLPVGFEPGTADAGRARLLLLHDGQNVFHPDSPWGGWRVDEAVSAAGYEDVVVLAIDNAPDRMDAYTHVRDDLGSGPIGGRADDYLRLVFEEALPFFRARYGLSASADDLAIGGSSLGGLVTLHIAQTRPTDLACAIAMSSTLGWGAFGGLGTEALVQRWTARGPVAIYLDSGGSGTCDDPDGDGVWEDSDDRDNYCTTLQLRDHLAGLGYTFDADLFHWWEPEATHDEAAWAARMPRALSSCVRAGWVAH